MTTSVILALANGLSIVATKHSGFPDQVIPGKNGFLANEADPEDLAREIRRAIDASPHWAEMSDFAREHALRTYDQRVLIDRQLSYYRELNPTVKKVAFVTGEFPTFGLTWLISQISDLNDRGIDVEIFNLKDGDLENVSEKFFSHNMATHMHSLAIPESFGMRVVKAFPKMFSMLIRRPRALLRSLNVMKYGMNALSLKLIFWVEPFIDESFDVVHCHFGPVANKYLLVREILGHDEKLIVSFYGYDVSNIFKEKGIHYYDTLQETADIFIAMSEDMKQRIVATGFFPEKIRVLPISIDVESVPFHRRSLEDGEMVHMVTMGRFVEKKGFDDLLRAIALLKKNGTRPFRCHIIGGGVLESEWKALAKELNVEDVVEWKGYMKIEDVPAYLETMHLYLQPSKTAKNGDME